MPRPPTKNRSFAYRKLSIAQQRLVHRHLSFHTKCRLRTISKRFSSSTVYPSAEFLLDGYYREINLRIHHRTAPVPADGRRRADVRLSVGNASQRWSGCHGIDLVNIDLHIRLQPNRFCAGIEFSDWGNDRHRRPLTLFPIRETSAGVTAYPYSKNFRIIDKLTRWMKFGRLNVAMDPSLCHPIQMLPDGFGELNIFRRRNFVIDRNFGKGYGAGPRHLNLAYYVPKDTCPDHATIKGHGLSAGEFLESFNDVFDGLINTAFLRLTQSYSKVNDCLESVSIIPQLVHHILQSPLPSTPERRRLVIIDVKLSAKPPRYRLPKMTKVAKKRSADAEAEMMANLGEMMNRMDIPFTTQLYQLMYPLGDESNERYQPTGIHAIIAQNYTSKKQLIHEAQYCLLHRSVGFHDLRLQWPTSMWHNN